MSGIASYRTKVTSWVASVTSPSATHASGMLILFGLLAATADAQVVKESSSSPRHPDAKDPSSSEGDTEDKPANQDMLYYIAMGMLVSQALIRFLTWISERREKAAEAARKKDDDLAQDAKKSKRAKKNGLSLDAFEGLDEEALLEEEVSESESEGEIERRRRVLAAGEAEIEE
ncbi:hypothetical protein BGZ92_011479 [Podila epicladia]|nr:hypothetical protein BGZ92_011479 [Podila epicladia]